MKKEIKSGVYFIYNPETKLTKIGCSNDIKKRFNDLQKQSSHLGYDVKLELIDYIYCVDYFGLENQIHNMFKEHRKINEWFEISTDKIKLINNYIDINTYMSLDFNGSNNKNPIYKYINNEYIFVGYVDTYKTLKIISQLTANEKIIYFMLRDFSQLYSNCIIINNVIPSFKDLEGVIGLSEKTIRTSCKNLDKKGLMRLIQSGHKKAIYINPYYYSSGKTINKDTLDMFKEDN